MVRLYSFAVRHPRRTILAGIVLSLVAGSGLFRLELRTDGYALVPREAPEVLYDREVRETFDVEDQIAVVVETRSPAGIFNLPTLRFVVDLTRDLADVDGIDPREVTSLATEHSRWSGRRNALDFNTFLDPFPETEADVERLRSDLAGVGIYTGTLVSKDGERTGAPWSPSATAILVGLENGADRAAVHRLVLDTVAARKDKASIDDDVHVVGAPIAESLLGTHILRDLSVLVPIAVLVMCLVFYARYRSAVAVLLPMSEVGAALVFVFGLMGHLGVPVSLTLIVMPVILTALGVADEIHVFDRYAHLLAHRREGETPRDALFQALAEMWRPVTKTSVTTGISFLSFTLSPIAPVRHFGMMTAVGVFFCMLWSLTVIPACLSLAPRTTFALASASTWAGRFALTGDQVRRRGRALLAAAVALALLTALGLPRLTVQDSWIDGFAETSPFRQSTETVNRLFHGTHILLVHLDTRPGVVAGELAVVPEGAQAPERLVARIPAADLTPAALVGEQVLIRDVPERLAGSAPSRRRRADMTATIKTVTPEGDELRVELDPALTERERRFLTLRPDRRWTFTATGERIYDPRLLERIHETGRFVAGQLADVGGGVLDPHDQIAVVRYVAHGGREEERRIGLTASRNRYLLSIFARVRGEERVEEVIDAEHRQALITVFLKNANFVDVGRLMGKIREYAREHLEPYGIRVGFAGDVAVSQAMIGAIVRTQSYSLLLSLLGILLVTAWLGRSLWLGLLCLLPPALAVLLNLALMGMAGIPLGVATSMFSAMTIGIGVDFAIHLTERFRRPGGAPSQDRRPGGAPSQSRRQAAALPAAGDRVREALTVTGPAIWVNTLVVALGFGVMTLSKVPANGRLGVLVVASVATCFLTTLVLLPWLLVRGTARGELAPSSESPAASRASCFQ